MKWVIRIGCVFVIAPLNSFLNLFIPSLGSSVNSVLITSVLHSITAVISLWLGYFKLSSFLNKAWDARSNKQTKDIPVSDSNPASPSIGNGVKILTFPNADTMQNEVCSDRDTSINPQYTKNCHRPRKAFTISLCIIIIILAAGNIYQYISYQDKLSSLQEENADLNSAIEDQANQLKVAQSRSRTKYDSGFDNGYAEGQELGYAEGYSSGYLAAVVDYADSNTNETLGIAILTILQTHEEDAEAFIAAYEWVKSWRYSHFGR